jgi:hypothetical protein
MSSPITLPYVGSTPASPTDLATYAYVNSLAGQGIAQSAVTTAINNAFAGYPTKASVDAMNALNATSAYVSTQDGLYVPLSGVGQANGATPLDASGRVSSANINAASSTQRWPAPFTSPTAYQSASVAVITSQTTGTLLYSFPVADPMFGGAAGLPYRLLVFGSVDCAPSLTDPLTHSYLKVFVTQGSTTGQTVGVGASMSEFYRVGVLTEFTSSGSYPVPTWMVPGYAIDLAGFGGGGAGQSGGTLTGGPGGGAGGFSATTVIYGNQLPLETPTIAFNIGGGGGANGAVSGVGGAGGTTTIVVPGGPTVTCGGGGPGSGSTGSQSGGNGAAAGTGSFNGNSYPGGGGGGTADIGGVGGGGGGGGNAVDVGSNDVGAPGGGGAAWAFAYPVPLVGPGGFARGPIPIMPWPVNDQTSITGATTLYVQVVASSLFDASGTITTVKPTLWITPIPA